MHIDIDPINKVLCVRFAEGTAHKTKEYLDGEVLVDISRNGRLLGIEFLKLDVPRSILNTLARQFRKPEIRKIHPNLANRVYA